MKIDFEVIGINKDYNVVVLKSGESELHMPMTEFDMLLTRVGSIIPINMVIPYEVCAQRRRDITAHHEEEARNNDI